MVNPVKGIGYLAGWMRGAQRPAGDVIGIEHVEDAVGGQHRQHPRRGIERQRPALAQGQQPGDGIDIAALEQAAEELRGEGATAIFAAIDGKPILIFFYNPDTPLGKEVLGFVKKLSEKQAGRIGIMALAVTSDAEMVRKHKGLQPPASIWRFGLQDRPARVRSGVQHS